ncbi:MAG TPA: alpha,alpha-trehalase TreF [Roseiarcus sp.]|nr:alpha,alpha-trehalase TreF [Roseiarcus sp.]
MNRRTCLALIAPFLLIAHPARAFERPAPPRVLFEDLYADVELEHIFPDSKEFADATPKSPPSEILALYHAQKPNSPEGLRRFVLAHFELPADVATPDVASGWAPIRQHIDVLWERLTRNTPTTAPYSSLLPLPRPYVVPGGRFRELYYWDSYFTMLGLAESGRTDLLEDMVQNFADLIDSYGHMPNGTRSYYLTRSQPPFFFAMVGLLSPMDPPASFARYLPQLKTEYAFWMEGEENLPAGAAHRRVVALDDGSILNRYWDDSDAPRDESYREDIAEAQTTQRDPRETYREIRAGAESGWDFSSRWFADSRTLVSIDTTEIIPIDLNALLFGLENAIRAGCERTGDHDCAEDYARRAATRRAAIDRYLWHQSRGVYLDYRWTLKQRVDRVSAATLYPLFTRVASEAQAASVARAAEGELLKAGGIVATTLDTGQQWDAPNGWAPLQWIAVAGLTNFGRNLLAEKVACRWMVNVSRVYRQTGKLLEKYDVIATDRPGGGGEYPTQDGFGWTNGVTRKLMTLYPADADLASVDLCPGGQGG